MGFLATLGVRVLRVLSTADVVLERGELTKTVARGLNGGECGGVGGRETEREVERLLGVSRSREGGEGGGGGVRRGVLHPPSPSSSSSSATLSAGVAGLPASSRMLRPRDLKRCAAGRASASRARDAVLSVLVPRRLIWRSSLRTSRK